MSGLGMIWAQDITGVIRARPRGPAHTATGALMAGWCA